MENKKCDCNNGQCGGTKQSTTAFDFWAAPDYSVFSIWTKEMQDNLEKWANLNVTYDPEKYDLVEKKDYKIKKLKESIEASKRQKENNRTLLAQSYEKIKEFDSNIDQCNEDIKQLEQELQELESKKKE